MPRAVAWEPGRATCGACKSKLDDMLVHVNSVSCDVLNSRCRGLWCLLAPKCTCIMLFLGANIVHIMDVWISVMQGLYTWFILGFLLL